jgi:hypothetical protein
MLQRFRDPHDRLFLFPFPLSLVRFLIAQGVHLRDEVARANQPLNVLERLRIRFLCHRRLEQYHFEIVHDASQPLQSALLRCLPHKRVSLNNADAS